MTCLYDYIGIKGYGSQEPLSGIFINQLQGITLDAIDKVAEKEQVNFTGVWDEVRKRAGMRLAKDFRIAMRKRYSLKAIKSVVRLEPVNQEDVIPAAEKYRGWVIDIGHRYRQNSFLSIFIDRISVTLTESAGNLVVKLFDEYGNELDSFEKANASEGENWFQVNRKYPAQRVFVAVDAESVPLYQATLPRECLGQFYWWFREYCQDCEPVAFAAEADKDAPADVDRTSHYFGIRVNFSAVCDYSSIICNNREEFTDVWLYLLGVELMNERLFSSRLNKYTTIDRKQAEELRDHFTVEYERALEETVKALVIKDDSCIECNPLVTTKQSLP